MTLLMKPSSLAWFRNPSYQARHTLRKNWAKSLDPSDRVQSFAPYSGRRCPTGRIMGVSYCHIKDPSPPLRGPSPRHTGARGVVSCLDRAIRSAPSLRPVLGEKVPDRADEGALSICFIIGSKDPSPPLRGPSPRITGARGVSARSKHTGVHIRTRTPAASPDRRGDYRVGCWHPVGGSRRRSGRPPGASSVRTRSG